MEYGVKGNIINRAQVPIVYLFFCYCYVQSSANTTDVNEMESLRQECEAAKKKTKATLEKYFAESDRLKGIIDEMHGMCADLTKVSLNVSSKLFKCL